MSTSSYPIESHEPQVQTPTTPEAAGPVELFTRVRTSVHDQRVFVLKLVFSAALWAIGAALALSSHAALIVAGVLLLGGIYTHWVELQHQCLHHSAFLRPGLHRLVGVPLGAPMLVSHSHYRVRHLQHHRYLGTDQDTEFFGFDTRQELTPRALIAGLFDYKRLAAVATDAWRCWRGTWAYDEGQVAPRARRQILEEYRLLSLLVVVAAIVALLGGGRAVLILWVLPVLFISTPLHFLVELPEHIGCDSDSIDVLRNTRSITGSWFSEWYTNGNNLHIEHHSAMMVPINQLRGRHDEVRQYAQYVDRSYVDFYRSLGRRLRDRPSARGVS